ncbi:MAG: type II secretion system F family protein [Myxococcota bacterium]
MNLTTALLVLGALFAATCIAMFAYSVASPRGGPLQTWVDRYAARLDRNTAFLLLPVTGSVVARSQVLVCGILLGSCLLFRRPWLVVALALAMLVPPATLSRLHRHRVRKLEQQLEPWLLMLSNALKATPSVADSVSSTLPLIRAPFSEEVDLLVKEMHLGTPLRRAILSMSRRVGSPAVTAALSSIIVASQTGGELSRALEKTAAGLRESARLEGVLRARTAEGRGQVVLLAAMPFALCFAIRGFDASYFDPTLNHPYGHMILAVCAVLWLGATVWAHQIVSVDL